MSSISLAAEYTWRVRGKTAVPHRLSTFVYPPPTSAAAARPGPPRTVAVVVAACMYIEETFDAATAAAREMDRSD